MTNFIGSRALPDLEYHCPDTLPRLMSCMEKMNGTFRVVAGCTDFIPAVRSGRWCFEDGLHLIDIRKIDTLHDITLEKDMVHIGAAASLSEIMSSATIKTHIPGLGEAIATMASPQIRNMGTMGGNICMASPAGDTLPSLLALDATITLLGPAGERSVALNAFFTGPGLHGMAKDEVLVRISVPIMDRHQALHFEKIGTRDAVVISIVSAAAWVRMEEDICVDARIALGSVAPTPVRVLKAESELKGKPLTPESIQAASAMVSEEITPISDVRAGADYRRDLSQTLSARALTACQNKLDG